MHSLKRARTRSGCYTCRRRKKRCDESHPICGACERLGIECNFPSPGRENINSRHSVRKSTSDRPKTEPTNMKLLPNISLQQLPGSVTAPELNNKTLPGFVLGLNCELKNSIINPYAMSQEASPSSDPLDPFDLLEINAQDENTHQTASAQQARDEETEYNTSGFPSNAPLDQKKSDDLTDSISYAPSTKELTERYPDLSEKGILLFEYFRDKQSLLMSVSPLNYFRSVYLVFALRCKAVLYALLAWAGFHAGLNDQGNEFFEKATSLVLNKESSKLAKEELLASILILAAAKIFSGDIKYWHDYMRWAAAVIQSHGGIFSFMESDSVKWLLKNFAYKEILRSSSSQLPALFTPAEFEFIFAQSMSTKLPDSLFACCEPLFVVISIINDMALKVGNVALDDRGALESIFKQTQAIEQRIKLAKPDERLLQALSAEEKNLQLHVFHVFKIVALLHIYQAVLHSNSATLRMRYMNLRLIEALHDLLGTSLEGLLAFPLFIAGICCSEESQRSKVIEMFNSVQIRLNFTHLEQVQMVVKEVWRLDEHGNKYVDWNELIESQGLNLSFC